MASLINKKKEQEEDEHTKMIKSLPSFKVNPARRGVSQDYNRYSKARERKNVSSAGH